MHDYELEFIKNAVKISNDRGRVEIWKGSAVKIALEILEDASRSGWMGGKDVERIEKILNDL